MNIDKLLKKIADTQDLAPQDNLTEIIERYSADELDEDTLDLVFAAAKPNFPKFLGLLDKNKK